MIRNKLPRFANEIIYKYLKLKKFKDSTSYWEKRYQKGGNSGPGSYDRLAEFKAEVLNLFVTQNDIQSVIEFGSGDGNQLLYYSFPKYLGFDVSQTAVNRCKSLFKDDHSKQFKTIEEYSSQKADMTISIDVIYHLVEDHVYHDHMSKLFESSNKYVIIYSSNSEELNEDVITKHVRHRKFNKWIEINHPKVKLLEKIDNRYPYDGNGDNTSLADFYIYQII